MNLRILALSACTLGLTVLGLTLLWLDPIVDSDHRLFYRQCAWTLIGIVMFLCCARIDYRIWGRVSFPLLWLAILGLVLVFVPPIGVSVNGSHRWLHLGSFYLQPSFFALLALILFLAWNLARFRPDPRRVAVLAFLVAWVCALIVTEWDFGTAFLASAAALAVFRASGLPRLVVFPLYWWPFLLGGILAAHNGLSWTDSILRLFPFLDANGENARSLCGQFLRWHWCGGSPGKGKLIGLLGPYALSDFTAATINEQFGSVTLTACAIAYVVLLMVAGDIMEKAPDRFAKLLAAGIVAFFEWSAFLHVGVLLRFLPIKAVPLAFLSLGGSGRCVALVCVGILISIARKIGNGPTVLRVRLGSTPLPG